LAFETQRKATGQNYAEAPKCSSSKLNLYSVFLQLIVASSISWPPSEPRQSARPLSTRLGPSTTHRSDLKLGVQHRSVPTASPTRHSFSDDWSFSEPAT
jgi:hypothetical protein